MACILSAGLLIWALQLEMGDENFESFINFMKFMKLSLFKKFIEILKWNCLSKISTGKLTEIHEII